MTSTPRTFSRRGLCRLGMACSHETRVRALCCHFSILAQYESGFGVHPERILESLRTPGPMAVSGVTARTVREDDRARSQSLMPCLLTAGPEHWDCKCRWVFCPAVPAPSWGGRSACPALLLAVAVLPPHPALPLPLPKGSRAPVCLGLRSPPPEAAGKPLPGALGPGTPSKLAASAQSCWDGRQPRQACRAKIKP